MLPKWRKKIKLGEITEIINWGTPSTKNSKYWNGDIPWITPKDLALQKDKKFISKWEKNISSLWLQKSSAKLVPKWAIILSSRAPVWYVAIASNMLSTNQWCKSIVCREDIIDNNFLYYWLKTNTKLLEQISWWATFKELRTESLKSLPILLPLSQSNKKSHQFLVNMMIL